MTLVDKQKARLEPQYLNLTDVQYMSGVSRFTWRNWCAQGKVKWIKLGNRILIPSEGGEPDTCGS